MFCVLSFWVCEIVSSLSTNQLDGKLDGEKISSIASSLFVPLVPSLCVQEGKACSQGRPSKPLNPNFRTNQKARISFMLMF
jgi:hypothetical protein